MDMDAMQIVSYTCCQTDEMLFHLYSDKIPGKLSVVGSKWFLFKVILFP